MKTQSRDTSEAAERKQIELMRAAGPVRRVQMAFSLSSSVIQLSRRALAEVHPQWDEREVLMQWIALHYGPELAAKVRHKHAKITAGSGTP